MIRTLKNVTQSDVTLNDLSGVVIAPNASFDGLSFGEADLKASNDVAIAILNGQLTVSDGSVEYERQMAIDLIQNNGGDQRTVDGKRIITSSDRPANTYRCFTGRGDDVAATPKKIGLGAPLTFDVAPNTSQTVDMKFVDNVFIRDGWINYVGAMPDTTLDVDVICPPNTPFPSPTGTGNLDYVNGSFVPNATNTGAYMMVGIEVTLFRFINHMHLIGNDKDMITSPEPFQLVAPYFLRFTVTNPVENTENVKAGVTVGLYRKTTL